jgi:hypothetical protein
MAWAGALITTNTTYRKLDMFPSSGKEREAPILLGPLERANLSHSSNWKLALSEGPNREGVSIPLA